MKDKQGRDYINFDDLKDGQTVWLDGGFTCKPPSAVTVETKDGKPFFRCGEGTHYFDGQVDDDAGFCVGVYPADPGPMDWAFAGD